MNGTLLDYYTDEQSKKSWNDIQEEVGNIVRIFMSCQLSALPFFYFNGALTLKIPSNIVSYKSPFNKKLYNSTRSTHALI